MSDFYDGMSPLQRILYRSSPRTHEYESLTGKIRRGERKKALEKIQDMYSPCTPEEALLIFDLFKQYALGTDGKLVEIDIETVPNEVAAWKETNKNPFLEYVIFFGRIGGTLGTLSYDKTHFGYRFNNATVTKKQIDQVWKFVPN
jgi:hypothetical protein